LLASDGGIDYRWGLGGLRSLAAAAGKPMRNMYQENGSQWRKL